MEGVIHTVYSSAQVMYGSTAAAAAAAVNKLIDAQPAVLMFQVVLCYPNLPTQGRPTPNYLPLQAVAAERFLTSVWRCAHRFLG